MDDKHPSLHPPLHGYSDSPSEAEAEAPQPSWVLLDLKAYIADRENYTSARAETTDGTPVRVTFCAAAPPLVSYICVWCPGLQPAKIGLETTVEAAESDLLLLEVSLHARRSTDYFVYKADDDGRGPSLRPVQIPQPCLDYQYHIALLAHRDVRPQGQREVERFLRRHGEGDSDFYIAALMNESSCGSEGCFMLWVFDSKEGRWSSKTVTVHCPLYHCTCKAINLGEGGLVGFVDPWRGIVVCDVLGDRPPRYLPMPQELIRNDQFLDEPLLSRDIALVGDRLTLVDMLVSTAPDVNLNWNWEVSTWSRKVCDLWEEDWRNDYNVQSHDISVPKNLDNVDLLPKLKVKKGMLRPTLGMRHVAHPILSLTDSHVVYIMAKVGRHDDKALVLSINLNKKKPRLQGVAKFDAERMLGISFSYTYTQSWIPKYLNPVVYAGVKEPLKRPGMFHVSYPRKQHSRINLMYGGMQPLGSAQEKNGAGASKGTGGENTIMDLD